MEDDWFGDFAPDLDWQSFAGLPSESGSEGDAIRAQTCGGSVQETQFLDNVVGRCVVHKRGLNLDMAELFAIMAQACPPERRSSMEIFMQYFILRSYGKRNIRKDAVEPEKLSAEQREVYERIRMELSNPVRRQRVFDFINQKDITKRLINYYVVHFSIGRELSYYLDRTSYPYKIIGEMNKPQQPEILARKERGDNIVWINFHQAYRDSKHQKGRRNRHAPYRRSTSVKGEDGEAYSLCELNFYLWLDEIGGFELFYFYEEEIRAEKHKYDERKRLQEQDIQVGKKKKRKIILRETDGRNYKSHVVKCATSAPYSLQTPNCSFMDFLAKARQAVEAQDAEPLQNTSPKRKKK